MPAKETKLKIMNTITFTALILTISLTDYIAFDLLMLALLALAVLAFFFYRLLEQLKRVKIRAQKNEEIKSSFLTHINNALRTPLDTINSYCETLEKDDKELTVEKRQEIISNIHKESNQMYTYLNELEELTNFDGAIPALSMIEVNLAELILSYRREILHETRKEVTVSIKTTMSPHCKATLDTTMFRQLIMLLLRIAAQRTKEGSITITYDWEREGLHFWIADTGDPIPEEIRGLLFTSLLNQGNLLQIENKTTITILNICKSIIDAMQGTIEALPRDNNRGVVISFWFPCHIKIS